MDSVLPRPRTPRKARRKNERSGESRFFWISGKTGGGQETSELTSEGLFQFRANPTFAPRPGLPPKGSARCYPALHPHFGPAARRRVCLRPFMGMAMRAANDGCRCGYLLPAQVLSWITEESFILSGEGWQRG